MSFATVGAAEAVIRIEELVGVELDELAKMLLSLLESAGDW